MGRVWEASTRTLAIVVSALCIAMLVVALVLADGGQATSAANPTASPLASPTPKPNLKRLTKAQFVSEADKICKKLDTVRLPQELTGLERRAKAVAKFRTQLLRVVDRLLALVPPKADKAYLEKHFFTALRDDKKIVTVFFTRMEKALRKGDLVELAQLQNAAYSVNVGFPSVEPLQKYGFRVCVPPPPTPIPVYQPAPYVPPTYPPYQPYYPTPSPYQPPPYVPPDPYPYPTPTPTPLIDLRP